MYKFISIGYLFFFILTLIKYYMRNVDHFLILIFSGDNEVSRHEFDHFYTQVLILVYECNYIRWFSHTSTETKRPLVFNCKNC